MVVRAVLLFSMVYRKILWHIACAGCGGMHADMTNNHQFSIACRFSIGLLAVTGLAIAQDQTPHPWRSVNDPPPAADQTVTSGPDQGSYGQNQAQSQGFPADQQVPAPPPLNSQQGAQPPYNTPYNNGPAPAPLAAVPAQLTINPGIYLTVRLNQSLSSDHNQVGDAFTGTLEQPVVIGGVVVARRGQIVSGHVTEAKKAGRVEGTSQLGVQLTELTLVDGQKEPIQTQMIVHSGPTSVGRDAAAIGGTTALGAAIGAGVGWGPGAAIGAGAGAAAGIIGVLLTRGHPTEIHPESVLMFRIESPVTFSTQQSPQAFQYVNPQQDYSPRPVLTQRPPAGGYGYGYGAPPPPPPAYGYAYPAPYPYPAYPYGYGYGYPVYGGVGVGVVIGPHYGYYGGYRGYYYRR
jgi:hypothetical protein